MNGSILYIVKFLYLFDKNTQDNSYADFDNNKNWTPLIASG